MGVLSCSVVCVVAITDNVTGSFCTADAIAT